MENNIKSTLIMLLSIASLITLFAFGSGNPKLYFSLYIPSLIVTSLGYFKIRQSF